MQSLPKPSEARILGRERGAARPGANHTPDMRDKATLSGRNKKGARRRPGWLGVSVGLGRDHEAKLDAFPLGLGAFRR